MIIFNNQSHKKIIKNLKHKTKPHQPKQSSKEYKTLSSYNRDARKIKIKIHQKIEGARVGNNHFFVRENYVKNGRVNGKFILRG